MVAPMVWRAAERENFVADTQAMRKRVIAHIPARDAGREIKLGAGGLRDVEFSVQLLQLVHGRVDERLRDRATLDALKALIDNGYVGRDDGKGFGLAYQFMRTLEHRIQLFHLRRTHVLPDNEGDLRRLGRSLGYAQPARAGPRDLEALRPEGPPAARAAVLLPAAGRGRPDPHQGPAADRVLGARTGSRRSATPTPRPPSGTSPPSARESPGRPRSSASCCRRCSAGSPRLRAPITVCSRSARSPTPSAAPRGISARCATRG